MITAKDLKAKLEVTDKVLADGDEYQIKAVNPLMFTGVDIKAKDLAGIDTKDKDEVAKRLKEIGNNRNVMEMLKDVLLAGVVEPKLVDCPIGQEKEDEVSVYLLLNRIDIASELYLKISDLTARTNKATPKE